MAKLISVTPSLNYLNELCPIGRERIDVILYLFVGRYFFVVYFEVNSITKNVFHNFESFVTLLFMGMWGQMFY